MHHKCMRTYFIAVGLFRATKSSRHVNSSGVLYRRHTQVSCLCESVKIINNVGTHQCTKFIYKGTHSCSAAKNEVNHVKNEASCCKTMPLFHSDTLFTQSQSLSKWYDNNSNCIKQHKSFHFKVYKMLVLFCSTIHVDTKTLNGKTKALMKSYIMA